MAQATATKQAPAEDKSLIEYQSRDGQKIQLSFHIVRKYLVSGKPEFVTDQEILLYMGMAKARGLNPFKKDCYLIKYTDKDPAATVVSIDYYRSRAKAQEDCRGWKSGIVVANPKNEIEYREGSILLDEEELLGGWFRARPANWTEEMTWAVGLKPYIKTTQEGKATRFWREENQPYMIAKVAESQGLRRLWPDEFQGIFIKEEIIDVTGHEEEPLKIPQATKETEDRRPPTTGTEETGDGRAKAGDGAKTGRQRSAVGGQPVRGQPSAVAPPDPKAEVLKWIAEVSDADFLDAKQWLTAAIKDKSQEDQLEICRAWTERKRKITSELQQAGKE